MSKSDITDSESRLDSIQDSNMPDINADAPLIDPGLPWPVREEIANVVLHGFGLLLGLMGFSVLMSLATLSGSMSRIVSSSIYGVTLLAVFAGSVIFHSTLALGLRWRKPFEILDHCAIFLLIAGTYTPFLMVSLGDGPGYGLLALVWALALGGILYKIFFFYRSDLLSTLAYIGMGWLAMFIVKPLLAVIGWPGLSLIALGGIFYTVGAVFYLRDKSFRFAHAVWHLCVLAGSISHYLAILNYVVRA